ncbi:MAG: iron-containing alcohol dehydrogenase [Clostridia bacterium]|nr:iron-containing alcohol dehydrogenase [Clostridia bacterium]
MKNFEYHAPTKVFFGKGNEEKIGEIIKSYGYKKVLLHYGKSSVIKSGLLDIVKNRLSENGISFLELGGVEPNPKLPLVQEGAALVKKENIDFILAIGGGSVIDSAKAIALSVANDADAWDIITGKAKAEKGFPIGVILTISAAGSEMSNSMVITNPDGMLKRGFGTNLNRPVFAVMNPALTCSVSKFQTGCGIVDIMMHTLERYFVLEPDNELTDRLAEALLVSVKNAGTAAIENPDDYEARATLMWASSLSHNDLTGCGKAYNFTVHMLEHEISGMFDRVPHGAGLAILFPAWAKYVYKYDVKKFAQLATRVWGIDYDFECPEKTALAGISATEEYFKSLGMPVRLFEFDIHEDSFEEMARKCTKHRPLYAGVDISDEHIVNIFKLAK